MADNMLGEGNDCLLNLTSSCEVAADLSVLGLYQLILPFIIVQYIQDNQSIIIIRVHAGNKVRIRPVSSLNTMYEMWAELKN